MDINNPSTNSKSASWAVLMTGGAKLTHLGSRGGKVHEQTLSGQSLGTGVLAQTTGQLFWGQLVPGGVVQVTGQPVASYVNRDATETAVALPDFDLGSTINTDPATLSSIAEKLGTPGTSPGGLSIGVDAGSVSPLNTQVTAIPALADPSALSWTFQTDTAPAYKLVDQNAQNSLNSYSFALAVLLGAAGACLLAGLQTLVGKTRSRKEQAARQSKP